MCIGIGYIDHTTGTEISLSVFYMLPVYLAVWYNNLFVGIALSLFATVVYLLGDQMANVKYSTAAIPYWNAFVRAVFLIITAYLLNRLRGMLQRAEEFASHDSLTQVANSRVFHQKLNDERIRMQRYQHPLTIVYIDVDNFKNINDQFGHTVGDSVLKIFAMMIKKQIREADTIARLGGDEFALLLPETSRNQIQSVLEKIQKVLHMINVEHDWHITISIGVATYTQAARSAESMVSTADDLMYKAKKRGKNQMVIEVFND